MESNDQTESNFKMKKTKFNPNDPKLWVDFNPFDAQTQEYVGGKSERQVIITRINQERAKDPNWLAKVAANNADPKVRAKRKASMPDQSGENNPFYGKKHAETTKLKISEKKKGTIPGNKGISHTKEALKKMRKPRSEEGKANMRGPRQKKTCPHCGFVGAGGNMPRYHFDNCKFKRVKK